MKTKTSSKFKITSLFSVVAIGALLLNGCSSTNSLPETSPEGMVAIKSTKNTIVYKHEYVNFSDYSQVTLDESKASFEKNWQRNYNKSQRVSSGRITDKDIEKATKQLADLMDELFLEEFKTAKGFVERGTTAKGTLLIRPSIINLKVNAPDKVTATRSHTYTDSSGEATLFLEIFDANSNELLARVIDRKEDHGMGSGFYQRTTRIDNRADLRRAIRGWAKALRARYDEIPR